MKIIGYIGLLALISVLAFFVTRERERLFPAHPIIETNCDLSQQDCQTRLPGGGTLQLGVFPKPIPLMQPLHFRLAINRAEWRPVHMDITGINMPMGLNRITFDLQDHTWRGQTILPVCTQRNMIWQAQLVLRQGEDSYRVQYRFTTRA